MTPQNLEDLLRLKRFESPPEGYEERFLAEFRERQRRELLQRSSITLFFERFHTYLGEVSGRKWVYVPAAAAFVAAALCLGSIIGEANVPSVPSVAQYTASADWGALADYPTARLGAEPFLRASYPPFPALQVDVKMRTDALEDPRDPDRRSFDDVRLISPDPDGRPKD